MACTHAPRSANMARAAALVALIASAGGLQPAPARRAGALSFSSTPQPFDWNELVTQERGLDFVRLRVLIDAEDAPDTRRPPFFALRAFGDARPDAETLAGLEALAAAALCEAASLY